MTASRDVTAEAKVTEAARLNELTAQEPDKNKALSDAFWALLNSRKFMFNH